MIVAKDVAARERLRTKLEKILANDFPSVVGRVYPARARAARRMARAIPRERTRPRQSARDRLEARAGVAANRNASKSTSTGSSPSREIRISIDQDEARRLGLSSRRWQRPQYGHLGNRVTQVRDDIYLIDVVATSDRRTARVSGDAAHYTGSASERANGSAQPVRDLQIRPGSSRGLAARPGAHADGRRPMSNGRTCRRRSSTELAPRRTSFATRRCRAAYCHRPWAVRWRRAQNSQASVIAVVPLMLLIMFTVLMIELHSFNAWPSSSASRPLGLIGVVAALLVSGKPLGFVAILGILALLGMITKNAVILIGQIEAERAQGKDVSEAVTRRQQPRFRPIMLTAISTVLGMIPIAPTVFWGPMAFSIMGGLLVATALTLVFLPTAYVAWFGDRKLAEAKS